MKLTHALKNEHGIFDLGSIMTGAIIIGITGAVIAATTLGIIPAIENSVAKSSLGSISMAQTSHKQGMGKYGNMQELVNEGLLEASYAPAGNPNVSQDGKFCTVVYPTGAYLAAAKGSKDKYFTVTDSALKPKEAPLADTCF